MKLPHTINTEVTMQLYHHFTLEERESLRILLSEGNSLRQIAGCIGKSVSSISREIKRNKNKDGSYHPWRATTLYIIRRHNSRRTFRLESDKDLKEWVCKGMDSFWSPEMIAERWKLLSPQNKLRHTTIYAALKRGMLPGYKTKTHLRRNGKRKCTHQCYTIHPEHLIREWPEEIVKRERVGDWEGDTVYGGIGKGLLVTLVDRKSRYLAAALLRSRNQDETKEAIVKVLEGKPVHSLSLDNGSEFSRFKELEAALDTTVYFADPHSPWQRGSNENINGLVRFFFPKGTNFHQVTKEQLDHVLSLINHRPRKCLGWLSPIEFLNKCCT